MKTIRPPALARLLLGLRRLGDRRDEIEADLLELFHARAQEHGPGYARRRFYGDVVSLWRPSPRLAGPPVPRADAAHLTHDIGRDIVYALRLFRRSPVAVSIAILGLGLAVGVSTSVFSILDAVVFRPSGIQDAAHAVRVLKGSRGGYSTSWPYGELVRLKQAASGVTVEGWMPQTEAFPTGDEGTAPAASVMFVTGGFLEALAARAEAGRLLNAGDDRVGAPPAIVVSHGFWVRRFGSDRSIVGTSIRWHGTEFTIVGVTERTFRGPTEAPPAFWAPISTYHVALGGPPLDEGSTAGVAAVGRIHPGNTRANVEASLGGIVAGFGRSAESGDGPAGVTLTDATGPIRASQVRLVALVLSIITTAIALVLLLACINVTNLLLAGAIARRHEIGLRVALGASRRRVARQLLTESLALGVVAGGLGLLFAAWFVPIIVSATRMPGYPETGLDARVYVFALVVSLIAGIGAGLAPARHAMRGDVAMPLRETRGAGGATSTWLRSTLIGAQAAASIVLIVVAALLTRGMIRATEVDVGFDADRLLTITASFPRGAYDERGAQSYWNLALERVRSQPGVRAASLTSSPPFSDTGNRVTIFRRPSRYTVYHHDTRADYFATLGLRPIRGRTYTQDEVDGRARVVVISETLARDFFPAEDPIGQPLDRVIEGSGRTIVGVVSDAITARLRELGAAVVYAPIEDTRSARMVVRTDLEPGTIVPSLRTSMASIDGRVRLDVVPVSHGLKRQLDEPRILATLAATLAALALVLAVIGIYGVTSFVVGLRTQEIGVRMALGARGSDVMRVLLGESLRPVAIGLAAGVGLALLCMRVFDGVLYGVSPWDPAAFGAAVVILLTAAALAVAIPTRRATRTDPAQL